MDQLLLLLLLLLGVFPVVFFPGVAPATLCMVCSNFKKGHCLRGKSNCTMEQGSGCRTRDFFFFTNEGNWAHKNTELDCSDHCWPSKFYYEDMKVSTFCCKGQKFCNKYQGRERE